MTARHFPTASRPWRSGASARRRRAGGVRLLSIFVAAALPALAGCANPKVLAASDSEVTVRYGGMFATLGEATALARKACAVHKARARLRTVTIHRFAGGQREAHFACLKN